MIPHQPTILGAPIILVLPDKTVDGADRDGLARR
jgi:hypothetical protein